MQKYTKICEDMLNYAKIYAHWDMLKCVLKFKNKFDIKIVGITILCCCHCS